MAARRWLKNWGPLCLAAIALVLSIRGAGLEMQQNKLEEIYYQLTVLDKRLEASEEQVNQWQNLGKDASHLESNLTQAKALRNQAVIEWNAEDYDECEAFISQAHDVLSQILVPLVLPPRRSEFDWILVGGVAGSATALGMVAWFTFALRRAEVIRLKVKRSKVRS